MMLEAWLLAAMALVSGLAIGLGAVAVVGRWLAAARAFTLSASELAPALAVTVLVALAVTTLAAALPAWRASRMDVARTLAQG
jgi:ABC-type antimicrobial peptide transport system permease subunit